MPWITDAALLAAIARRLGKDEADLEPHFAHVAAKAVADARADVRTILFGLGYTTADVEAWDDLATYHERLATYFAFSTPPLGEAGAVAEPALDCRDQLRKFTAIAVGGVPRGPTAGATQVGGIGHGRMTAADETPDADWFR